MSEVYINIPQLKYSEGSSFSATAYFREGEASEVPTTASYRLDCLTTGKELKDWTALTPAASIAIAIKATENALQNQSNKNEKKQITVARNPDGATQVRRTRTWKVINNKALPDT